MSGTQSYNHQSDQLPTTVDNNLMRMVNCVIYSLTMTVLVVEQLVDSQSDGQSGDNLNKTIQLGASSTYKYLIKNDL